MLVDRGLCGRHDLIVRYGGAGRGHRARDLRPEPRIIGRGVFAGREFGFDGGQVGHLGNLAGCGWGWKGVRLSGIAARQGEAQVTLRFDPDVVERVRADGPGWRGRINEALQGETYVINALSLQCTVMSDRNQSCAATLLQPHSS